MAERSFQVEGATVRRPGRAILVAAGVMTLPVVEFIAFGAGLGSRSMAYVGMVAILEAALLLIIVTIWPHVILGTGKPDATRVEASDAGLSVDGRLTLPASRIASVAHRGRGGDARPSLVVAGRSIFSTVEIHHADDEAVRTLARVLDPDSSLATFVVESGSLVREHSLLRFLRRAAVVLPIATLAWIIVARYLHRVVPIGFLPIMLTAGVSLFRGPPPSRARLGADGIALQLPNGTSRFVRYTAIASITAIARGAIVRLKNDTELTLRIAGNDPSVDVQGEALARAVEDAIAHHRSETNVAEDPATRMLERGTRPASEWLAALHKLAEARASGAHRAYRIGDLSRERLLSVLESVHGSSSARAGAAVLLALSAEDANALDRVRVASTRAAAPGLRVALETLADGETDAPRVTRALAAIDD